jgi:hypothetical protein
MVAATYPVRVDGALDRHLSGSTLSLSAMPEPCDIR